MNKEYYYIVRIEQIITLMSALQSLTECGKLLYDNSHDNKTLMPLLSKMAEDMYILSLHINETAAEVNEEMMNITEDDTE